jgi:dihydrodipicolinate synthase/N-acetylneuraminate lyase
VTGTTAPRPGGIVCPLATPLLSDGSVNEPVLRALIDALVPDLDGLFALGSSGELPWLREEVALRVAHVAVEHVAGRIPVYVGVGDTGTARTLERVARLADAGADFVVVTTPLYYPVVSERRLVDHFETVAERAPVPIVLYNIPQHTHCRLTPAVVEALAGHPRIAGIKDSSGDWAAFDRILALRSDGFSVLQGRERLAAVSLWAGADGVISSISNFAPRLLQALAASVRDDGMRSESLALQATIRQLATVFEQGDWLAGLKCALQATGWDVGEPSSGIEPYDAAQRAVVEAVVASPDLVGWLTTASAGTGPGWRSR